MNKIGRYLVFSVIAWLFVDFTTTEAIIGARIYYSTYMPLLLVFYVGYPLVFVLLRYGFHMKTRGLVLSMIVGIFIVEILLSGNTLFFTFPVLLLAIPLALVYYSMVTLVPLWLAENRLKDHRVEFIVITILYILGSLLNLANHLQG